MSTLIKNIEPIEPITEKHLPIIIGTVGESAGVGLFAFIKQYYSCPDIKLIIANPNLCIVPASTIEQYAAMAYLVHNTTVNNGDKLAIYLARFQEEFQLIFGRMLLAKNEKLFDLHFKHLIALVEKYTK
jgi:hypothetical protein